MSKPILVNESNVSLAWGKAVWEVRKNQYRPLCVSITDFKSDEIEEIPEIRTTLNSLLREKAIVSARETSETIFPYHYWSPKKPTQEELFTWYREKYLPRHRARARLTPSHITAETYFERLVAYKGYKEVGGEIEPETINQLERIINVYKHYSALGRNPSPSKFIATCLNPSTDNNNMSPYVSFPCLQQIGFSFAGGAVSVTGFYTIQYLMKRGYGNYLGLCYLGQFMARETGLPLARVNCFVGNPRVDSGFNKNNLGPILEYVEKSDE